MTKWQYEVKYASTNGDVRLETVLKEQGEKGWELVTVNIGQYNTPGGPIEHHTMVFKRPIEPIYISMSGPTLPKW